jgi:hypothetical protein
LMAAYIAGFVTSTNAITLNTTDDGLSVAGMFFAKLEMIHSKLMSGDVGNVRLQAPCYAT